MRRVPSSSPRAACSAKGSPPSPNGHGSRSFNIDLPLNPSSPEWSLPEAYPACRQTPGTPRPSHGFALLGPDVDAKLRPLGKDGNPLCDNVFFIGKTLGGYDHAAEKSGNGVALSTALFAAMNA